MFSSNGVKHSSFFQLILKDKSRIFSRWSYTAVQTSIASYKKTATFGLHELIAHSLAK